MNFAKQTQFFLKLKGTKTRLSAATIFSCSAWAWRVFSPDLRLFDLIQHRIGIGGPVGLAALASAATALLLGQRKHKVSSPIKPNFSSSSRNKDTSMRYDDLFSEEANLIRLKLNGQVVAEYPGEPDRPKAGPIGLQLHDHTAVAMFRNIRIQEVGK